MFLKAALQSVVGSFLLLASQISGANPLLKMQELENNAARFGTYADIYMATFLWDILRYEKLVGPDAIRTVPYKGSEPHGAILETLSTRVRINGRLADIIVKKNYMGEGMTRSKVVESPKEYLKAVTIMYKAWNGYDAENKDWFWAKYQPDGNLDKTEDESFLAGRIKMCVECHRAAEGDDFRFNNDVSLLDQ